MQTYESLETETKKTLDDSLANQVIKLFAVIAKADTVISREELDFVAAFLENRYPPNIASYLFKRFREYTSSELNLQTIADAINNKLSYQAKLFSLIKTYELITADEAAEVEIETAHRIVHLLKIRKPDIDFIEKHFGIRSVTDDQLFLSSIISLSISDDPSTADVFLHYPHLRIQMLKIFDQYIIIKKDDTVSVVTNGHALTPNCAERIMHNSDIYVDDYVIKYNDLRIYFENRIQPLHTSVFLDFRDGGFSLERRRSDDSVLQMDTEGSILSLIPIDRNSMITIHRKPSSACSTDSDGTSAVTGNARALGRTKRITEETRVNFNDTVLVNGFRLNLKDMYLNFSSEMEIDLPPGKNIYTIGNEPSADVYFSDDFCDRWRITLREDRGKFHIDIGECPYHLYINNKPLDGSRTISTNDTIYIKNHFIRFDIPNRKVMKKIFRFRKLVARGIRHMFDKNSLALDDISFDINLGDLVCVMGPSGCGKSTLLNIISGMYEPNDGHILLNQHNLSKNFKIIKDYLGYVPQDDLLLANLTVYENLYYYAKLRFPHKSREEINSQIDLVLHDIGLAEKRGSRVGEPTQKTLSGGERKRLNIGLELLSDAEVFLLDEPTSGLSSKDSEMIMNLMANIANRGKIVLSVIHQPGSKLYKLFNKIILLDKGGRLVFSGDTYEALKYFNEYIEKNISDESDELECPLCKTVQPDLLLDSMQQSLRDIDGTLLKERKYPPQYWKEKFIEYSREMKTLSLRMPSMESLPPPRHITLRERFRQFTTLFSRNLKNKIRDRSNLLITFLEAPLLGAAVGFILRYAPFGEYSLYTNEVFRVFLFVSVIVCIFLSMTNSIDEIISDAPLFLRERMLNLQKRSYLASKILILLPFSVIQNILFVLAGFLILEVRELYIHYVLFLSAVSLAGISIGLFISAIPNLSLKAAQNIIPLILVPQIILGGALIQYEKMNVQLYMYDKSPIPEICQIMPSRWAYEGMMVLQESYNRFDTKRTRLLAAIKDLKMNRDDVMALDGEEYYYQRLEELESEREAHYEKYKDRYGNADIHDAIIYAEHLFEEQRAESASSAKTEAGMLSGLKGEYPMFVKNKTLPGINWEVNTAVYNALVILFIAAIINTATLILLKFRDILKYIIVLVYRRVGSCVTDSG